jgi:hypothetical protein
MNAGLTGIGRAPSPGRVRLVRNHEADRGVPFCAASLVEAFNLTNRRNVITRNSTFGPGSYPSSPLPSFNTVTAVGDARTVQFGFRLSF